MTFLFVFSPKVMWYIKYGFLALLVVVIAPGITYHLVDLPSDAGLTTEQQVRKYGYPFETHMVTTDDGYLLSAHRIPHGKHNDAPNRRVVLLVPGLWHSSEVYVNFGPENSLAFILADNGFDVWMGNYRGTTWSRKHVSLDPDQNAKEFWNYSLDEMGNYDGPAFIDYILKTTGREKLTYVGLHVGASIFFIMASEKPLYSDKVDLMVAFAPAVNLKNSQTIIYRTFSTFKDQIQRVADFLETYEILRHVKWLSSLEILVCSERFILRNVCGAIHSLGVGPNLPQLNMTTIPLLLNGFPAGSSLKQLLHVTQLYETGIFARYSYGATQNRIVYGQKAPPVYDLSKITTPVSLYFGENDVLVDKSAMEPVAALLGNVISTNMVKGFNDGDFLWAIDVVKVIYEKLILLIKSI